MPALPALPRPAVLHACTATLVCLAVTLSAPTSAASLVAAPAPVPAATLAADRPAHPLPSGAGLRDALAAAWALSPSARTLEARREEIAAGLEAARSWTAAGPTVGLTQRSDRWADRDGRRETDLSLSAPFLLPGQRSARETLAQASAEELDAQIAQARLALAGDVREKTWAVAAAREMLDETGDHQQHLEALAKEVMRRVEAGDLARTDGMFARQEVLAASAAVTLARGRLNEALVSYRTLTGQAAGIEPVVEAISESPDGPSTAPMPAPAGASPGGSASEPVREITAGSAALAGAHPRVMAAKAALLRAQASRALVTASRSESPVVGLSMQHERAATAGAASRTIGVLVQIPLGSNARSRPLETAALTQVETARAEVAQTERAVANDLSLARQQLTLARQALAAASARTALTREHLQLIEKAYRLGERGLADWLRAQALEHEADAAERQQRVAVSLAHARINQASGVLP